MEEQDTQGTRDDDREDDVPRLPVPDPAGDRCGARPGRSRPVGPMQRRRYQAEWSWHQ